MRIHPIAAVLAGLAVAGVASEAAAQRLKEIPTPDSQQRGCVETDKVYGAKFIVVDGYRYGGCLVKGADQNLDALRALIRATQATGQYRDNRYGGGGERYLVLGDTSPMKRIEATGTWNGAPANVRMDWDYRIPGIRLFVTSPGGATNIWVASDSRAKAGGATGHIEQPELFGSGPREGVQLAAWKEQPMGVYAGKSDMSPQELLTIAYLMPSGVVHAGRDAANKMTVAKQGANEVLTIPVEALGADLVATLNAKGEPIHTEITVGGKKYTGDFANFLNDRGDYEVYFPFDITLTRDGQVFADLDLDFHHTNPYLIFPVPTEVASN